MEIRNPQSKKAIRIFLFFTFALSSIFYYLILHSGKLGSGSGLYVTGLMFCPSLSAFVTCKILKRKINLLGWQWGNPIYQVWAYLVPLIYSLIAYLIIWLFGWGGFYSTTFVADTAKSFGWVSPDYVTIFLFFMFTALYGIVGSLSQALGEQIGWRGFLVPEIARNASYTKTSIIVGLSVRSGVFRS